MAYISVEITTRVGFLFVSALDRPSVPNAIMIEELQSYSHDITEDEGFSSASFSVVGVPKDLFYDWLSPERLLCNVIARNEYGVTVWEGFINSISINYGPLSVEYGPVMDVVNNVRARYRTKRYDTNPPIGGDERVTDWIGDSQSQATYGTMNEEIEAGECTEAEAIQAVYGHLADFAWPKSEISVQPGTSDSNQATLEINCLGYSAMLEKEYYGVEGILEMNASDKLFDALSYSSFLVVDTDYISQNPIPVAVYDADKSRTIRDVIVDTLSLGKDGTLTDKFTFGIYEERKPVYSPLGNQIAYVYNPFLPEQDIRTLTGRNIPYSEARPSNYMYIAGLFEDDRFRPLTTSVLFADFRAEAQSSLPVYISSVSYRYPDDTLEIKGRGNNLVARLARHYGIGGKS